MREDQREQKEQPEVQGTDMQAQVETVVVEATGDTVVKVAQEGKGVTAVQEI